MPEALLVYCTCPDRETADRVAGELVARRLAACVNILDSLVSVYRWQGEVQRDPELLLLVKTSSVRYDELQQAIVELHPYELPEVIAVPIGQGLPGYLDWIDRCTTQES